MPAVPGSSPVLPHEVLVEGTPVRYAVTGRQDDDRAGDLVLVHGHGAHHVWWHAVVPLLADRWRVVTFDLSGHGDSGHRAGYSGQQWAREIVAVAEAAGARRPVVVGHSLGGRVALLAGGGHPDRIAGLVLIDCGILVPETLKGRTLPPPRPPKVYPTREAAVAAFRLGPSQPEPPAELFAPVAEYSVRAVEGGWTWKHGGQQFPTLYDEHVMHAATSLTIPVAYVSGGASLVVDDAKAAEVTGMLPGVRAVRVPGLHHHMVLEDPAICARLIDELARA
ncbi:Pimeloyl-ACP methyl ester carboxylesterase [Trujillonella endophytica]|uniref:Pimeloyl-ACP methyl ester carboxylesterase n=1 Tax=Trujillonella endophytica TaxID=673521 RepID=A0A1H8UMS3_9ACTN|nr:Pimeloyl-ACP methyl ester carboxylesterase [Trujillella endophytica]